MRSKFAVLASVAVLAAALPVAAQAVILDFMLSGSRNATFQLDSNPIPSSGSTSVFGDQIQFLNVAGTFNGVAGAAPSIGFGSGLFAALNINGTSLGFTQFVGGPLFSGTFTAPVFAPGTFNLTSIGSGASTLTISRAVAAVPEPSSWGMMIAGFGLTGAVLRSRRRRAPLALA